MEAIPELDVAMANVWPPEVVERNGPWLHRSASGITRRANSVLALGVPESLTQAIEQAEEFYQQHHLPTVFLLSDASSPSDLEAILFARGYERSAETTLVWAKIDDALSALAPGAAAQVDMAGERVARFGFTSEAVASDGWFKSYYSTVGPYPPTGSKARVLRNQLLAPRLTTSFVSAWRNPVAAVSEGGAGSADGMDLEGSSDSAGTARGVASGQVADAVVQVVVDGDWACIQCLATSPQARRQGAGLSILSEALLQAKGLGASRVFAAVMVSNHASSALFRRAGFIESHRYFYLVQRLSIET